ncbi:MAG TPA: amidase, partial [Terriglobales bacterium]|nr:amidase [Terriglobales bacterium]
MINASLRELGQALAQRQVSSVELTRLFLDRAQRFNPQLNAFVTLDPEASLAQAWAADERIGRGQGNALTGIPIALKDIFLTKGWLTTCASKILSNFVAPYDAHVVEKLRAAGAVNLGKTNMDEFAMG